MHKKEINNYFSLSKRSIELKSLAFLESLGTRKPNNTIVKRATATKLV